MMCAFLIGAPDILLMTEPSMVATDGAAGPGVTNARQTEKRRHFGMTDKAVCTLDRKISCGTKSHRLMYRRATSIRRRQPAALDLFSERPRSNPIIQT